ncbi:MAG: precorrin-8X methylmutase [Caloramator sp.]|nr:precorrin-8X methylmutase [Caloramator sp.]
MYITNPMEIEKKSFMIIDEGLKKGDFSSKEILVVKRIIHTTGDFDYQDIIKFSKDAVEKAVEFLKKGCSIVTDTKMAFSGVNKNSVKKSNSIINCYIDDERVYKLSLENNITRSMASMDVAAMEGADFFVIGNAPTALFRLGELIKEGKVNPKFIIGVPVGFVGASDSKEYIREFNIPSITTVGTKGGSNVAASILNALLYMAVGR